MISPIKISPFGRNTIVFSPSELSPTIWLEAQADKYTLTTSRISTWSATNGSNATQTSAAARPIPVADNGVDVIDFNDSARWLDLNSTLVNVVNTNNNNGGFEVWSILKFDNGRQTGTIVYFGARTATKLYFTFFLGGSGKLRWFLGDTVGVDARALTANSVFPAGQTDWVLVRLVHREATNQMDIWVNGVQMSLDLVENGDTSLLDFTNFNPVLNIHLNGRNNDTVHDSGSSGMLFGDFMAFNRLLTTDEATNLTNYYI